MCNLEPLVSISCITYNHAPYIRQCLDGFLMQKTDFAFEVLIHDDASTDGTTEIIKEYEEKYPHIIKPMYEEENQWVKGIRGSWVFNIPRAKGEYIAFCEGDDFWTDPGKLQKQVDILLKNPEITLVHSAFKTINESGEVIKRDFFEKCMSISRSGYVLEQLLRGNYILTLTTCVRKSVILNTDYLANYDGNIMDYYYFVKSAMQGPVSYMTDITGAYRNNSNGMVANSPDTILRTFVEIYKCAVLDLIRRKTLKMSRIFIRAIYRSVKWYLDGTDKEFIIMLYKTLKKR